MKTLKFLFTPQFEIGDYVKYNGKLSRILAYAGRVKDNIAEIDRYVIYVDTPEGHNADAACYPAFDSMGNKVRFPESIAYYASPSLVKMCPPEENPMKFSDLRPGMIVKVKWSHMKDAHYLLVKTEEGKLFGINERNYTLFSEATEDMKSSDDSWSIEEVYKPKFIQCFSSILNNSACLNCIWKRVPKYTELTMDQIAEKFEIPVEQLKIKK